MSLSLLGIKTTGVASPEQLAANVESSSRLGFEEAIPRKRLSIIANGPSARNLPHLVGDIMALNGALALCLEKDIRPEFWAACDPQEVVLDFLSEIPFDVKYLVASKCHPKVFDRLKSRDTRIFHVGDTEHSSLVPVRYGSSISLTALHLARLLGYTDIDVYGWDCCMLEGEHHASGSTHPVSLSRLDIRMSPEGAIVKSFYTTLAWAKEVDQAFGHIRELALWGVRVNVHGPGMLSTALASISPFGEAS